MSEQLEIAPAPPELPRLRIHHLLVLTAIFSLLMAMQMGFARFFLALSNNSEAMEFSGGVSVLVITNELSTSVCIAIVLFGLAWRKHGIAFPSQPGHWVAMYLALSFLYTMMHSVSFLVQQFDVASELISWVMMPVTPIFRCLALALWIVAYLREPARIWKWGWAVMAIRSIFYVLLSLYIVTARCINWISEVFWYRQLNWQPYHVFNSLFGPSASLWISLLSLYACVVFFVVAVSSDFRNDRRHHWSHWLVIILVFASSVVHIPYYHWALIEYF